MPQSFLYSLLVLAVIAFMLWFALGTRANIAKGNRVLEWLQAGLPRLGRRTKLRWLGSSAVQLDVVEPHEPFTEAQIVIVLEPRDLGWLWAWSRSRGRRDLLILRGQLRSAPGFELEAGAVEGWTAHDRLRNLDPSAWVGAEWPDDVSVRHTENAETAAVQRSWDAFVTTGARVWRMSVRRERPHVEIHLALPEGERVGADGVITSFVELARSVVKT